MSYGADWHCDCGWANLDVRKKCRNCGKLNNEIERLRADSAALRARVEELARASYVKDCFVDARDGDPDLFRFSDAGSTVRLDGYHVIPSEKFAAVEAERDAALADSAALRARVDRAEAALLRIAFDGDVSCLSSTASEVPQWIAYLALGGRVECGVRMDTRETIARAALTEGDRK